MLVGGMKCGTTTLSYLLGTHPDIERPILKEVRYLSGGTINRKTTSWYASNFQPLARAITREISDSGTWSSKVTFDASPTYLMDMDVATPWILRHIPETKLLAILRNPVDRSYSHHRMGVDFALSSQRCKCLFDSNCRNDHHKGDSKLMNDTRAEVLSSVLSFAWVARVGIAELAAARCGVSEPRSQLARVWMRKRSYVPVLKFEMNESHSLCVKRRFGPSVYSATLETVSSLQANDAIPEEVQQTAYRTYQMLNTCAQGMARPKKVVENSLYVKRIRTWLKTFGRQLKVLTLEDLKSDGKRTMSGVYQFLGIRPFAHTTLSLQNSKCVSGPNGVLSSPKDDVFIQDRSIRQDSSSGGIRNCSTRTRAPNSSTLSSPANKEAARVLREFYEPYNKKLYALIGKNLRW